MRWGLIGASDIAANSLIPAIRAQPGGEVVGVYSRSAGARRGVRAAARHPAQHGPARGSPRRRGVEAVYVSTTNERHRDETAAAASAGKSVLCEKPLALTVEDAHTMVEACAKAGVVLATNHGRRNDPVFRTAQRLVPRAPSGGPSRRGASTRSCCPSGCTGGA